VPGGERLVPFGKASVYEEGADVTVVSIGQMLKTTLAEAAFGAALALVTRAGPQPPG
jgi:pyruvate/2-oxoglutarate/acetoin dehydrogenase E1 component